MQELNSNLSASLPNITTSSMSDFYNYESILCDDDNMPDASILMAAYQDPPSSQCENVPDGCCPLCGIQLYQIREKGRARKKKAVPVKDIKGKVENGRCLSCEQLCESMSSVGLSSDKSSAPTTCYVGEYNFYGQRHGPGELIWDNGDRYVGNFFNGVRDGNGSLFLRDGSNYSGDWECNEMHGSGTRKFANRDVYTGEYAHGKRHGQGKLLFSNGDVYNGSWQNDVFHGFGRYFYHDETHIALQGQFCEGRKHGKFKMQHPNGTLDIVRYDHDRLEGPGVRWSKNRCHTWLLRNGQQKKKVPIAEAVSIGYKTDLTIAAEDTAVAIAISANHDPGSLHHVA